MKHLIIFSLLLLVGETFAQKREHAEHSGYRGFSSFEKKHTDTLETDTISVLGSQKDRGVSILSGDYTFKAKTESKTIRGDSFNFSANITVPAYIESTGGMISSVYGTSGSISGCDHEACNLALMQMANLYQMQKANYELVYAAYKIATGTGYSTTTTTTTKKTSWSKSWQSSSIKNTICKTYIDKGAIKVKPTTWDYFTSNRK